MYAEPGCHILTVCQWILLLGLKPTIVIYDATGFADDEPQDSFSQLGAQTKL